ncbi:MAG TPA: baseplate J/gp47 family protein [Fusobacterium sp.]|uniref:baseplate assembly protein n=1 Tax=Fusobacterium sp. TaxID=68766 RepID=UPI002F4138EE
MKNLENYEILVSNAEELKKEMIREYQRLSGITLHEASPETLIFSSVAYLMALREEFYNDQAKQKYLRFARGERLDLQGEIYGERGKRLYSQAAQANFRFSIISIQSSDIVIPKGSLIQYNELYFSTDEEYKILKGKTFVEGIATCLTTGIQGNGIPIGQINTMVDLYPYYSSVENISITTGGTDIESDEAYRERIRKIPESFTVAGSVGAYEFWVKSTSPEIIDVSIESEKPCEVDIYPWTKGGLASSELKQKISKTVNGDFVRPLTDKVTIKDPKIIKFDIELNYYIGKENEAFVNTIQEEVKKKIDEYILWQKSKLGRDINPDEIIKSLKIAGVKRIEMSKPVFQKLSNKEVAIAKNIVLNYQGVEDL